MSAQESTDDIRTELDATLKRHRELASEHARVAEFSAQVYDEAAALHDTLDAPLLDPAALRRHAAESRKTAALERARAAEDPADG